MNLTVCKTDNRWKMIVQKINRSGRAELSTWENSTVIFGKSNVTDNKNVCKHYSS